MALADIDPYPWFLNKPIDLTVNEQLVRAKISASEWADHWRPLLGRLLDLWQAKQGKRFLIAIAGPPASGKSVLAEQLHWIIEKQFFHRDARSVALPMDGFHFTNAHLKGHFRTLSDGTQVPLSKVKGQPDTIDIVRLRSYIQMLISQTEGNMMWPGYSRFTHDVVPDKFAIHGYTNIVIVEGNYLLVDRGPFVGIPEMFDLKMYVESPGPKVITTLVERHIKGGKDLEEAKDWVKRIDLPNARIAESTKGNADVVIERDSDGDISVVHWKGHAELTTRASASPTGDDEKD